MNRCELIQRVRDLLVTAGNAGFTDSEREDVARQLEGLREQLIAVANRTDSAGRTLYGGLGGAPTPFVDLYTPSGNGVAFNGQRGQAAAGNTALPQALDGQAIWMQVPQGNGRFAVRPAQHQHRWREHQHGRGGSTRPAYTGNDYQITFAEVAGQMQYTVIDVTNGNTPLASHTGVPYQPGKSVQFAGMGFTINGNPAAGDAIDIEGVAGPFRHLPGGAERGRCAALRRRQRVGPPQPGTGPRHDRGRRRPRPCAAGPRSCG